MSASRTARAVSGANLGSGARPLRRRLVRAPNGSHPTKKVPSTVIRCGSKVARQGAYRVTDLPEDESDLLARIHTSIQAALSDGKVLLDVEVPVQYFDGVVGVGGQDSIAISEFNACMSVLRKIVRLFEWLGQAESVRVFFPDAAECSIALKGAGLNPVSGQWEQAATFHDWPGAVDYLLRDDFVSQTSRKAYGYADLPDFLAGKRDVEQTAEVADRLYVVGYPYDNTGEMEQVMRLWEEHARPILVFNGNLDGVRTSFAPFGKAKKLKHEFVPKFTTAFYVHKFAAGTAPGLLYRQYPSPWRVYRAAKGGGMECVAEYDERPELRDVAMQFFSGGLTTTDVAVSTSPPVELDDDNTRYYEALGVDKGCSDRKALAAAYRDKARELHPDAPNGDAMAFYELSKAYAVLRDDEKRAKYDEFGERWVLETSK